MHLVASDDTVSEYMHKLLRERDGIIPIDEAEVYIKERFRCFPLHEVLYDTSVPGKPLEGIGMLRLSWLFTVEDRNIRAFKLP
jgi:hypothetical protein